MHAGPAIAFANKGYHILCEKPMAVTRENCNRIAEAVDRNKVILAVAHVMRYTPYSRKFKEILSSKKYGKIINIQHLEPVGYYHAAHSYVRGNWKNADTSSFKVQNFL